MKRTSCCLIWAVCVLVLSGAASPQAKVDQFLGRWALTIPGEGAGWLGVEQKDGYLDASLLWGGGSVVPLDSVSIDDSLLYVTRIRNVDRKDKDGKVIRTQKYTEVLVGRLVDGTLKMMQIVPKTDGTGFDRSEFTGKKIAPLPAKPDVSAAKLGKPITLFNGKNLDGWTLTNPGQKSGWSVKDGVLANNAAQEEGKPHISYGNLRTVAEFDDFNLKLDVNVPEGGNSGVYLRGIYEVQVADTYGRGLDSHNMGGVYSRITPTESAEKPAGQWQTMDITLLERHVTVVLNGKKIIDNQPLMGCTGGALWSDEFKPGPVYLQGDHTGVSYRNIVLTPIVK